MIDLVLTCSVDGCRDRVVLAARGHRLGAEFSGTCPSCGSVLQLRPAVTSSRWRRRRGGCRRGPALDLRSVAVDVTGSVVPR